MYRVVALGYDRQLAEPVWWGAFVSEGGVSGESDGSIIIATIILLRFDMRDREKQIKKILI